MIKRVYISFFLVSFYVPYLGANQNGQAYDAAVQDLTNTCMDARNHKSKPGPEDSLHAQCSPWANRSCCTVKTSISVHTEHMYNFDWSHCSQVQSTSEKCRRHFVQDLCFYECSPNVGPWLVGVEQKIRKQRFMYVPLCRSDCDAWFNDCIDDYTCTDNWGLNFKWVNGRNQCPVSSVCSNFRSVYNNNSTYFCETIWDHSWKVVDDKEHCMRLWFNPEHGNPNDAVAKWKAEEIVRMQMQTNSSGAVPQGSFTSIISLISIWLWSSIHNHYLI